MAVGEGKGDVRRSTGVSGATPTCGRRNAMMAVKELRLEKIEIAGGKNQETQSQTEQQQKIWWKAPRPGVCVSAWVFFLEIAILSSVKRFQFIRHPPVFELLSHCRPASPPKHAGGFHQLIYTIIESPQRTSCPSFLSRFRCFPSPTPRSKPQTDNRTH